MFNSSLFDGARVNWTFLLLSRTWFERLMVATAVPFALNKWCQANGNRWFSIRWCCCVEDSDAMTRPSWSQNGHTTSISTVGIVGVSALFYLCAFVHIFASLRPSACGPGCAWKCESVCVYVRMCVFAPTCVYACACTFVQVCVFDVYVWWDVSVVGMCVYVRYACMCVCHVCTCIRPRIEISICKSIWCYM